MASSTNLLYSLPELLWINILKNVSSEDALNVISEYSHISDAVQPYKALLLFGKVVPFLTDWSYDRDRPDRLNLPDLRSCRLVCKNWSSEINLMFQTQAMYLVDTSTSWETDLERLNPYEIWWTSTLDIEFKSLSDFAKFSQQFETLAGNRSPFPSRSFTLTFEKLWESEPKDTKQETEEYENAAIEKYWTLLIDFLGKFGQHIQHFSLTTGWFSFSYDSFRILNGVLQLQNLSSCLRLLPNLKYFHLHIYNRERWTFNSKTEFDLEAAKFIGCPDLPKIEIGQFYIRTQEVQLQDCFVTAFSSTLKKLGVSPTKILDNYGYKSIIFPELIRLNVFPVNVPEEIEQMNHITSSAPQLRKISLFADVGPDFKMKIIQALESMPNRENFKLEEDAYDDMRITLSIKH